MKRYIILSAALALLFTGCTGGFVDPGLEWANGGNGSGGSGSGGGGGNGSGSIASRIVGTWQRYVRIDSEDGEWQIIEFKITREFVIRHGNATYSSGTFTTNDGVLTMISPGENQKFSCSITDTTLSLTTNESDSEIAGIYTRR